MRQLTYTLDENLSPSEMNSLVRTHPAYTHARTRLQLVLEPNCDQEFIQARIREAEQSLPDCTTVGLTTFGPIIPQMHFEAKTVCSFVLFEHSDLHVGVYDCTRMTSQEAGEAFCDLLDGLTDVQGIFCVSSNMQLEMTPFLEQVGKRYPKLPIFGTKAGTRDLTNDQSAVFVRGTVYHTGIFAIAFCGDDLEIKTDYNLGWKPVGNDRIVTSCDAQGRVETIDGKPAIDIYRHYLNVVPDEHFFENACSFPLVVRSGRHLIAHVPLTDLPDGSLQFPTAFEQGAHIRFSYAHPDFLLQQTRVSANEMAVFRPQALVLFACINRRVFLGDQQANREFSYYRHVCNSMAWAYGYGEILRTPDGGGMLNSTIAVVGMREGKPVGEPIEPLSENVRESDSSIPLSERLATFLDATTTELNQTIDELETMAKRDPLTGAFNRRRMDELLHYELTKRRRENDLVLLMYDIDHFKEVNDTYGHDVGDVVLKDLTSCVLACMREGDTLGRWGGEEFLCLLTDLSVEQARGVAERLRERVRQTPFFRVGHITISIGVTAARADDTPETFFQRVDRAMYDAKHAGRNCVAVR